MNIKLKEYKLDDFDKKQKNLDILNSKISLILPELMSRNIKLGERLKNKLKVSTLFNNIEHRNKKYLKGFIFSSNKRARDLKTGLEMSKAIKQSTKKLTLLCNQMKDDLILKNTDILLKEKKLLSENTEQETHSKINDFIHTIKNAIKPPTTFRISSSKKFIKSMSEEEITKAKEIMGIKILKEENDIQDKINKYINKMRSSFDNKDYEMNKIKIKKDFNKYTENMYLENNIKFINYKRAKPQQIKDKESANLVRIKKFLYPSNFDFDEKKEKENKANKQNNNIILKRNSSMNDIYLSKKNETTKNTQNIEDKLKNIDVSGKDTMEILNNLVDQGELLSERLQKKLEKVNNLIEINLPFPSNYELILNYIKKHPYLKNNNNLNKSYELVQPISDERKTKKKIKITPIMRSKLLSIREDIDIETNKDDVLKKNLIKSSSLPYIIKQNSIKNNNTNNNDKSINLKSSEVNSTNAEQKSESVFITSKQ